MATPAHVIGATLLVRPAGRLDARACADFEAEVADRLGREARGLVLNLQDVTYLSSASLRVFLALSRQAARQGGQFAIAGVQPYCREVLRISGLATVLPMFATAAEALAALEPGHEEWTRPEGTFRFAPGGEEPGFVDVLGHIEEVLAARVTAAGLGSRAFSAKEFSLGLGGLGASTEEVLPLIGEMMTIGGTMVWLPTDGGDVPDYLVPRAESEVVQMRTAFNVSLAGGFHEYVHFRSAVAEGTSLSGLYRALFDLAAERQPARYRGALGVAMRAEVAAVHGSGVRRAPIAALAPANGRRIIDPENFSEWFEYDVEPRWRGVTGLITGVGLDGRADLSGFDAAALDAAFYRNPANRPELDCTLHNHGVFFSPRPFPDPPRELEVELREVVEQGEFVDMRHLLDRTAVTRAWIGLSYVQDFRREGAESAG